MAIATGLAIAMAASAGAQAVGGAIKAKKQSTAAKKAAAQQQAGAREATGYQREGLSQIGQLYSPYINSGASAMGTLGQLTTPGSRARFASQGPPNGMPQPTSAYGENPDAYGGGRFAQPRDPQMGGGGYSPGGGFRRRSPFQSFGPPPPPEEGSPENPIPMAKGGVVTVNKPTTFLAGEAGPERVAVKPLTRPNARMPAVPGMQIPSRPNAPMPVIPGMQATPHVAGSVRANAARAAAQQARNPLPPEAQRQQAVMQQQEQELRAREGAINPNSGIAGGQGGPALVPEQYGAMGENSGGPWGNMMQAGAQMGSAMAQPQGDYQMRQDAGGLGGPMAQALPQQRALQMKQAQMQQKQAQMQQQRQMMQQRAQMRPQPQMGQMPMQRMLTPPQGDPRSAAEFEAHRAAGQAAGNDMSWMDQAYGRGY